MAKRNKANNNGKRIRYHGGEHVIVRKLNALGTVESVSRIEGYSAVLIIDLDVGITVAVSPNDVELRGY